MSSVPGPDITDKEEANPSPFSLPERREEYARYFKNLYSWNFDFEEFQNNWIQLADIKNPATLYFTLYNTARTLRNLPDEERDNVNEFFETESGIDLWESRVLSRLGSYNARMLTGIIWSFGELDYRPSQNFIVEWCKTALKKIPMMNGHDAHDILRGFNRLAQHPGDKLMSALLDKAEKHLPEYNSFQFTAILHSIGRLAARPDRDFIKACNERADTLFTDTSDHSSMDLLIYLWSMAALSVSSGAHTPSAHIEKFIDRAERMDPANVNNHGLYNQVCAYFNIGRHYPLPAQFNPSSRWERSLRHIFTSVSGFKPLGDVPIRGLQHSPDIIGEYQGRMIVIEADGPRHFIQLLDGKKMFDGSTRLQTALLARGLPEARILRLNFNDNRRDESGHENLLTALADGPAGAYKTSIARNGKIKPIPFFGKNTIPPMAELK